MMIIPESGIYYSFKFNEDSPYDSYVEYIRSLPINPEPEALGCTIMQILPAIKMV